MRTTIVPAQITTVEDKIAANLSMSQLALLIAPIFIGGACFVVLPPFFSYAIYKVGLIALLALTCGTLAIRIKGKILLLWAIAIARYNLRPTYYVFDKNSLHTRQFSPDRSAIEEMPTQEMAPELRQAPMGNELATAELVQVEALIASPAADVRFTTTKKGGLRVHLNEKAHENFSQAAN